MAELIDILNQVLAQVREFDPREHTSGQCAQLVELLATVENAVAAARLRAAAQAAAAGEHRARGYAGAEDWVAASSGSTMREARCALEAVRVVEQCTETRAALCAGEVSIAQAGEIAKAVAEVPGCEGELLELARDASLGAVRDAARSRRVAAMDAEQLHARQHAAREVRHWRDGLGMVCVAATLPPEVGLPLVRRLDIETARRRRHARAEGTAERWQAHAADALISLFESSDAGRPTSVDLVIVCDLNAYRRGHAHPGELSHIVGGGPLPVKVIRELCKDAFLKAVLHDGVELRTVAHFGRHIPAALRTALELGPLPDLDGASCIELGCDRRYHLEWDHREPFAAGGVTAWENLDARCAPHHQEKTERDRRAGRIGDGSPEPRAAGDGDAEGQPP